MKLEDLLKGCLESTRPRVSHLPPINCDFCGGEHFTNNCHVYSMKNSWWEQELHPYNQYEEERTSNLENVFMVFMEYHASSKANQNSMQNQEIQVGKNYSMENCQWEQESQPYNQYEEERISNLDNLLMQLKETYESTQHVFKNLEIQQKKVVKFVVTREENFVEVEVHEEILRKRWKKMRRKHNNNERSSHNIFQVNTPPHQLIVKEERHGEHDKSLNVIFFLITSTSLAMIWKVFLGYMSFMESLTKRRKCKEDVFYVTFMPP
ncbi:hypothetical protein HKD37_17G047605 [Glycine soja]